MKSKSFIRIISSFAIIIALFLIGYLIYNLVAMSNPASGENPNDTTTPNNKEEKMFEISFASGLYNVDGKVITLTHPDLQLTTIFFIFTDLTNSNNPEDVSFEVVFEPNIDFTIKETKVSFKYTQECQMKVKIVVEKRNYTQIESFLIKTEQTRGIV